MSESAMDTLGCTRALQPGPPTWPHKDLPRPGKCKWRQTATNIHTDDCPLPNLRRSDNVPRQRLCRRCFLGEETASQLLGTGIHQVQDWDDPRDPYNNTSTGYLGTRRKSMLSNPLLVKHKLGTSFRCCRRLPCPDFTYGHLPDHSPSALLALRGWLEESNLSQATDNKKTLPETNFLALNRAAISAGICAHEDWRDFRNTHRARYSESQKQEKKPAAIKLHPDTTYGRPNNYVTTAAEIMSGQEQADWLHYVKACNPAQPEDTTSLWTENHAYNLRMFKKPTGLKPDIPWRLPKFLEKAKPNLSTFRSPQQASRAHKADSYEKIGRQGIFGHGIPTKASNRADAVCCFKP